MPINSKTKNLSPFAISFSMKTTIFTMGTFCTHLQSWQSLTRPLLIGLEFTWMQYTAILHIPRMEIVGRMNMTTCFSPCPDISHGLMVTHSQRDYFSSETANRKKVRASLSIAIMEPICGPWLDTMK